ncbi:MAG: multidrug transporter AcrB [Candidatus Glassbacteria bacterium RIFCSPLOWO2_12_FULL_58_11]|uniref:Multidrug transporter AcrB n=1 Tax=Candidatus Glassbacteria bacterium RIFCSPLOWO2_12_FULL_58_11 TaxID=1817867 RepID=A0A1F5YSG0_9BACT|nr:MAG: multidrug transporter AcrB [Candidatus Glassbacteria bacterium RIFCSPLOWO2_12_FULL_58_11]
MRSMEFAGKLGQSFMQSKVTPLLVVAAVFLGLVSLLKTPREEEPQIVVPMADVMVGLPGATPAEVESRLTKPMEKMFWEIPGVEYVYSISRPQGALVIVRFKVGEDLEKSLVKLYNKIFYNMDQMPAGATLPLIKYRSIDNVPVLALTLWSDRYEGYELRRMAAELADKIKQGKNVSEITVIGGQRRALQVNLDPERLAAYGLSILQLEPLIRQANANLQAGAFDSKNERYLVESGAPIASKEELERIVVGVREGRPVYLENVAEVVDGPEEVNNYVFFGLGPAAASKGLNPEKHDQYRYPAVTLAVSKRQGSDASQVASEAISRAESLKGIIIPQDVNLTVTRNYGATADEKANELLFHLLISIIAVTVIIALSLSWRGAAIILISVPVTFALTLFSYYVFDYTINRVTLFALIFVTGLVVDDSIIIVENIYRHYSLRALPPFQAAVAAINEVGNPTILATLTVIVAILPLVTVGGLMGPYMKPMPVGATLAMIFSLFVALMITPWFAYRFLRTSYGKSHGNAVKTEETRTYQLYRKFMLPLIHQPRLRWGFILLVVMIVVGSVALMAWRLVEVKMLPFDNKSEVQVIIDMPEGTPLERTNRVAMEIGDYLRGVPEVTDYQIYAGNSAPYNFNGLIRHYFLRMQPELADIQVNMVGKHERKRQSHDIAVAIREPITAIGDKYGARIKIAEIPPGPPVIATLVAEVYGPDYQDQLAVASEIRKIFERTPGVVDVDWMVDDEQVKYDFVVDQEKAGLHGISTGQISQTLYYALNPAPVGNARMDSELEPVNILLRLPVSRRSSLQDLKNIYLTSPTGTQVALGDLVGIKQDVLPKTIYRKNLRRVIYVTADVARQIESPVYAILDMDKEIEAITPPGGGYQIEKYYASYPESEQKVSMKWDGEWDITQEVFRDMGGSFAVVIVLMYFLLVAWFHSFFTPLIMMIPIPLSLAGVIPGHWVLGAFFTATSMIGFIALAGIMVRNSVLLIDFIEARLDQGMSLIDAVIESGAVRFRPIALTAGAVIVGAVVILFDPIFSGLAVSLLFGALVSTILTLFVVPLFYYLFKVRFGHLDTVKHND